MELLIIDYKGQIDLIYALCGSQTLNTHLSNTHTIHNLGHHHIHSLASKVSNFQSYHLITPNHFVFSISLSLSLSLSHTHTHTCMHTWNIHASIKSFSPPIDESHPFSISLSRSQGKHAIPCIIGITREEQVKDRYYAYRNKTEYHLYWHSCSLYSKLGLCVSAWVCICMCVHVCV